MYRPNSEYLYDPIIFFLIFCHFLFEGYNNVVILQSLYHYSFVVPEHSVDYFDSFAWYAVRKEDDIWIRIYKCFSVVSGWNNHIWLVHTTDRYLMIHFHRNNICLYLLCWLDYYDGCLNCYYRYFCHYHLVHLFHHFVHYLL